MKNAENASKSGVCDAWTLQKGEDRGREGANTFTPPYAVLGPAPAGERCSLCGGGSPRPSRIKRGAQVEIWHGDCAAKYVGAAADPPRPPPPPENRLLSPQERVEAAERLGFEFVLEEPTGVTWIYAAGVDFTDPMIKHAEIGIGANRSAVDAFLRWRAAQGKPKP